MVGPAIAVYCLCALALSRSIQGRFCLHSGFLIKLHDFAEIYPFRIFDKNLVHVHTMMKLKHTPSYNHRFSLCLTIFMTTITTYNYLI